MKRGHRLFEVGGTIQCLTKGKEQQQKKIRQRTSKPAIYSQL